MEPLLTKRSNTTQRRDYVVAALLFIGALIIRAAVLNWELPYVDHVDEPALLEVAIRMARENDPNPHHFLYPSGFYYLLVATIKLHAWWGISQGLYTSIQDIPIKNHGFTTVPELFVWARMLTAFLGATAVPALFFLGRRMFNPWVGLLSALALAFAPFHVTHSMYITTDAPTGIWLIVSLIGAWIVTTRGSLSGYILAGLAAGLAAGTKYNAGVVILALPLAHALYWRWSNWWRQLARLGLGILPALVAFLLTTPYAVFDWENFLGALRFNAAHYRSGSHGDFIGSWQVGEYSAFLWNSGLFAPACVLMLVGFPLLLYRFPRQSALLLTVTAGELLLLLSYSVNFVRNLLPVFPLLLLIAAASLVALVDLISHHRARFVTLFTLALALLCPHIHRTGWQLRYWSHPYTMVAAADAVRLLPRGMRIAAEAPETLFGGDAVVFPVKRITAHTLEWYRAHGFRYLLVNDALRNTNDLSIYERLRKATKTVIEYPPRRQGIQPGPGGRILDLGDSETLMPFTRHNLQFGDTIALLGYEIRPGPPRSRISPLDGAHVRTFAAGQAVQLNLYWRTLTPMDNDYTLFLHVINRYGERVAQRDLPLRHNDYPTSRWRQGELVAERADFPFPELPTGEYRIDIGLYDAVTGARLPLEAPEQGAKDSALLTMVTIHEAPLQQ